MIAIPTNLRWWEEEPGGREWLERLPTMAQELAERWSLRLGQPFTGGEVSLVLEASAADGTPCVLKINFPEPESEHEAPAMEHWGGRGAAALLDHDPQRRALLLERCLPGTTVWELPESDGATRIMGAVMGELHRSRPPAGVFRTLELEAQRWARELPGEWERLGRPFETSLLDAGLGLLSELAVSQGAGVLLHQDLHGGNVVRRGQEWCAIDPKPLVGEAEFDAASYLRDRRDELAGGPGFAPAIRRRLELLAAEFGLDRERMRGWGDRPRPGMGARLRVGGRGDDRGRAGAARGLTCSSDAGRSSDGMTARHIGAPVRFALHE